MFESMTVPSKGNFVIVKADKNDKKEISRLMMDVFFRTDPSSLYSKVAQSPKLSAVMEEISVDCVHEGMSFVAKEKESDKTAIGVALNGIRPTTLTSSFMENIMKKVKEECERTLLELWTFVSTMPLNADENFEGEKEVFEVRYLVVDSLQRNRGIATALFNSSIKEAAEKGYKFVRVDCTSHFTARIASAAGMNCIYEMDYADYKNKQGMKVFKNVIPPHTKIFVYAGKSSQQL